MHQSVYILMAADKERTGNVREVPVGVVSDEKVAQRFYNADPKNRDYILFVVDDVPQITGDESKYIPEPDVSEAESQKMTQRLDETNKKVQDVTQRMKDIMKEWGKSKSK